MTLLAEIALTPGGVISWLFVGLIAGWLAGLAMKGGGYGFVWDVILGLVGAFVGGMLFGLLYDGQTGFIGSIIVAFIGACVLVGITRAIAPRRTRI